jgi:hypothetical protein
MRLDRRMIELEAKLLRISIRLQIFGHPDWHVAPMTTDWKGMLRVMLKDFNTSLKNPLHFSTEICVSWKVRIARQKLSKKLTRHQSGESTRDEQIL